MKKSLLLAIVICFIVLSGIVAQTKKLIYTWGDSLTAGAGGEGTSYPSVLQNLLGDEYTVVNNGVGGESSLTIAARQGGIPMKLTNDVILPADGSPVVLGDLINSGMVSTWNDMPVYPLLQGGGNTINNCIINGIECTISWTGTRHDDPNGQYLIKKTDGSDGDVTQLPAYSIITTSSMTSYNGSFANVFFIGQNGGYSDFSDYAAQYQAMIKFSQCSNYLILGLTSGSQSDRCALEWYFTQKFGNRYVNLREYLSSRGLADAGICPTRAGREAMDIGVVPPSLLVDGVHFNATGYELIGKLIYARLQELGMIEQLAMKTEKQFEKDGLLTLLCNSKMFIVLNPDNYVQL